MNEHNLDRQESAHGEDAQTTRLKEAAALFDAQDYDGALNLYRALYEQNPANVHARYGAAAVLHARGRHQDAITLLRSAIERQPNFITCHNLLGLVLKRSGDLEGAATVFRNALATAEERPILHLNLGNVLVQQDRLHEAAAAYRRAIELKPGFAAAHYRLGNALFRHGRFEPALSSYRRARQLAPGLLGAWAGEANILMFQGQSADALALIEPLIDSGDYDTTLAALYAELCQETDHCDRARDILQNRLDTPQLAQADEANLRFALGRLLDRKGHYDEAFVELEQANRLKENPDVHQKELRRLIATIDVFDRDFFTTAPRAAGESEQPVFIVGMPRSGTSLVEQIITSHSQVAGGGELLFMNELAASLDDLTEARAPYPYAARHLTQETVNRLAENYLGETTVLAGSATRVTDKMPHNFVHLGLIAQLFPHARIIHCVRDPRDTCLSCYTQDFGEAHAYSYKLEFLAEYYKLYRRLMAHWETVLPMPLFTVRYEDLVANQESVSRTLIGHCGLEWEPACLDFHTSRRRVATASHEQVRQPLYSRSIGKWKRYGQHLEPLLRTLEQDNE